MMCGNFVSITLLIYTKSVSGHIDNHVSLSLVFFTIQCVSEQQYQVFTEDILTPCEILISHGVWQEEFLKVPVLTLG